MELELRYEIRHSQVISLDIRSSNYCLSGAIDRTTIAWLVQQTGQSHAKGKETQTYYEGTCTNYEADAHESWRLAKFRHSKWHRDTAIEDNSTVLARKQWLYLLIGWSPVIPRFRAYFLFLLFIWHWIRNAQVRPDFLCPVTLPNNN